MKLICEGLDLVEAVMKVIKAASNKTVNPILEGIKLTAEDDTLTLVATDSELAIEKKIKANVLVEGETVVPGKFFSEFVKKLANEQVELDLNEKNQLKIKYTDSEVYIQCLNAIEYPTIQKIDNAQFFTIAQNNFKNLIEKTIFSVALDDSRPILKGCLFEIEENTITSVALDGFRLAKATYPILEQTARTSVIVPGRSLNEISKLLDDADENIRVFIQRNYLMVQVNNTKIITRLIDGDFINYKQIINNSFSTQVIINKSQFEDSLDRASILGRVSNDNIVKLQMKDNILTLTASSEIGNVTEKINIVLNGADLSICFDSRFLKDCLKSIQDEFIKLCFTSSVSPCIITANEGNNYLFLILPLKKTD
ncbi:MAG: DNA polymerase III subunit beta [Christensenellales bacterium]